MDVVSAENEKAEADSAAVTPARCCHSNSSYLYFAFFGSILSESDCLATGYREQVLAAALKAPGEVICPH